MSVPSLPPAQQAETVRSVGGLQFMCPTCNGICGSRYNGVCFDCYSKIKLGTANASPAANSTAPEVK